MVVVSVNYRLGVLGGFVNLSGVGDPRLADGQNLGILDLALALEWVRDNVEAFGGDPGCVTVAGESAGGHCVGALLAMPAANGLFHRGIIQSPQRLRSHEMAETEAVTNAFEQAFGSDLSSSLFDANPMRIIEAQIPILHKFLHTSLALPFMTSLQPMVLPMQMLLAASVGTAKDIPLLVGSTVDETANMFPVTVSEEDEDDLLLSLIRAMLPELSPTGQTDFMDAYREVGWTSAANPAPPRRGSLFASDFMIRVPAERLMLAQAKIQPNVYSYIFDSPSLMGIGSFHMLELPYLFGTTTLPAWSVHVDPTHEGMITAAIQQSWAAFAQTGRPTSEQLPEWPAYESLKRRTMVIGAQPRVVSNLWRARLSAWENGAVDW